MSEKILIICYDYFPLLTPNSLRWVSISEYWARQGYEVYILCAWQPHVARYEVRNGVKVFRVGGGLSQRIREKIMSKHSSIVLNSINKSSRLSVKQRLILLIKQLHEATWKRIYWPDFACLWFFPAIKKADELVKQNDIRKMISVSVPFTDHLVAYYIKKKYANTQWVADVIDPSFFPDLYLTNNNHVYHRLNLAVEKKVFLQMNALTVLTSTMQRRYADRYPEYKNKISVNPNLLQLIEESKECFFTRNEKIRMVFIGTLNKMVRNPIHALQIFDMLLKTQLGENLELHFFGPVDSCMALFAPYNILLNKRIFLHGKVSREMAVRAMQSADILVNIGNANPFQEPSKVIEYASTGKPIINITSISEDSSALALEKYPAVINVLCQPMGIENNAQITKLVKFIQQPPYVDKDFLKEWVAPYEICAISKNYLTLLNQNKQS